MTPTTGIIKTGVANTASVSAALRRAGAEPEFVDNGADVESFDRIVVPGVGAFEAGMNALEEMEIIDALIDRIEADEPTFLVCLGMQLLAESSDESPGISGLGIIDTHVGAFPPGVPTPQFGWNEVEPTSSMRHLDSGYAYFANSYRIVNQPDGWNCAMADHGGRFVAAMERGSILACQFHPELSGSFGQGIVNQWIGSDDR